MLRRYRGNHTMTKKDIVRRIASELGRTELETRPLVQRTLDAIINVLAEEGRLELRNFGVFVVKKRKPKRARNPITGEQIMVGERFTATFKPGWNVEERVAMKRRGTGPAGAGVVLARCGKK
jgi:nucleoid DNA-binding protein